MYRNATVAVVIPAFNEEERIQRTVASIPSYVDWVLVVDDASTDETAGRASTISKRGLEVLRHQANGGVGAAILTGYRRALCLRAELIAVMAGDNQMDPRDLPDLLNACAKKNVGYAKGNRFLRREVWSRMPKNRLVGNLVLS